MKVSSGAEQIQKASQEVFRTIQQAQQTNQEMANKMIKLSLEQKANTQRDKLVQNLVDLYI